jgi:hypothetical protein
MEIQALGWEANLRDKISHKMFSFKATKSCSSQNPENSLFFATIAKVARWFVFQPKIPIWEKKFRALEWKMLVYFMAIWNIL